MDGQRFDELTEASVRALTKVVQVLPPRLRRRADALRAVTDSAGWAGPGGTVDPRHLTVVAQACRDTERLAFSYRAADGTGTDRFVEPHRLVALGRRWYLVAHDLDRGEWRTFRLDRLVAPRATGARFAPRTLPAEDAATFVRAALGVRGTPIPVEVLVHAPAGEVRGRIGQWSAVQPVDDGSCRVRMETDDLAWPAFALGLTGAECTVVSPPELRSLLGEWAQRFGRAAVG